MNQIKIKNYGSVETTYKENNKPPKHSIVNWDGDYDGKTAKLNINFPTKKKHSKFVFTNNELLDLFGTNINSMDLDKRLINDVLSQDYIPNTSITPIFLSNEMPVKLNTTRKMVKKNIKRKQISKRIKNKKRIKKRISK